ncbi:MAG: Quinone oxidoreductase 1 [Myxococcota bacterium]|nr:Quinone oxidoreductase 1 [Myxococcota bacterium]
MKAITYERYGPPLEVLSLRDIPKPEPGRNEILVRVMASSVNPADGYMTTGSPFPIRLMAGLFKPQRPTPGRDFSGVVEAVGPAVRDFKAGDEVHGESERNGAFAEYLCVPESQAGLKPANLNFEEAAAVPLAAVTALQGLRDSGKLQPGQQVLINGAAGGVGSFAIQIARALGGEVTGVCSSRNVEAVRSLGAARVIDYSREDLITWGGEYDLILDLVGNRSVSDWRKVLKPKGIFVAVAGAISSLFRVFLMSLLDRRFTVLAAKQTRQDLMVLKEMCESGSIKPCISRRTGLPDVPEALHRQGEGHGQGKTVIRIAVPWSRGGS